MKFHPQKCKVLSLCNRDSPLSERSSLGIFIFPFNRFHYPLGGVPLEYADSEKDLGILVNPNFNFTNQHDALLSKANLKFGLLKPNTTTTTDLFECFIRLPNNNCKWATDRLRIRKGNLHKMFSLHCTVHSKVYSTTNNDVYHIEDSAFTNVYRYRCRYISWEYQPHTCY